MYKRTKEFSQNASIQIKNADLNQHVFIQGATAFPSHDNYRNPIGYYHMVKEVDAHEVASLFEVLFQRIIILARMDISARVIVGEG